MKINLKYILLVGICLSALAKTYAQTNPQDKVMQAIKDSLRVLELKKIDNLGGLSKDNLILMGMHSSMLGSSDKLFQWCFSEPGKLDSIAHYPDYSQIVSNLIINHEEIEPAVSYCKRSGGEPHWRHIQHSITKKYDKDRALTLVLNARLKWYKYKKDGRRYAKYLIPQIELMIAQHTMPNDWRGAAALNDNAWDVFRFGTNRRQFRKALTWVEKAIKIDPQPSKLDTKANLLYRLGRKAEALKFEEQALMLSAKENNGIQDSGIQDSYHKMLRNEVTWPDRM